MRDAQIAVIIRVSRLSSIYPGSDSDEAMGRCPKCGRIFFTKAWWMEEDIYDILKRYERESSY